MFLTAYIVTEDPKMVAVVICYLSELEAAWFVTGTRGNNPCVFDGFEAAFKTRFIPADTSRIAFDRLPPQVIPRPSTGT